MTIKIGRVQRDSGYCVGQPNQIALSRAHISNFRAIGMVAQREDAYSFTPL